MDSTNSRNEDATSHNSNDLDEIVEQKTRGDEEEAIDSPAEQKKPEVQPQAPQPPPPPPNGGRVAWTQCLDTFLLWFAAWGLVNSFGVFQTYYGEGTLFTASSSRISWIGSLQLCIFILGSVVVGPLYDVGWLGALLIIGTFLVVFGMVLTSLQTNYAGVLLSQGLCTGLGMTCLFIPCVSVLPPYFSTRRALAMGIAAAGSSVGAILFTVIFQQLIPQVGFGWTVRVLALVLLVSLTPPILTMRKRIAHSTRRRLVDPSALGEPPFIIVLVVMFVIFLGMYVPYFYIEDFAIRSKALRNGQTGLIKYLIVLLNGGSLVGRLLPNLVADRIGPWNTIVTMAFITGVLGFSWIPVHNEGGLIVFALMYGFFSGGFVSLVPVMWASLSPDPKVLGTRVGMFTVPMALGLLLGNPIAGALWSSHSSAPLQVFCGATVIAGAALLLLARIVKGRQWRL